MSGGVMSEPEITTEAVTGHASYGRVVRDQKKTFFVAIGLSVACYWQIGRASCRERV